MVIIDVVSVEGRASVVVESKPVLRSDVRLMREYSAPVCGSRESNSERLEFSNSGKESGPRGW